MSLRLNDLHPREGSRKKVKRLGRGQGCHGKTAGKGHKGQHARAGGFKKNNFEGGQTPLQRRLPKVGFRSHKNLEVYELGLNRLEVLSGQLVTLDELKALRLVPKKAVSARIILKGKLLKSIKISPEGIYLTAGAKAAILKAGGTIESIPSSEV